MGGVGSNVNHKRNQRLLVGTSDDEFTAQGSSTSSVDIEGADNDRLSVALARKQKSHSELDLKKSFEEFSRNFSCRRAGSGPLYNDNNDSLNNNDNRQPQLLQQSPSEAAENEDQVGMLNPVHHHNQLLRAHAQAPLEFRKGFSSVPRSSIL